MSDNEKQMLRFLYYCMVSTKGKKGEVSAHLLPAKTMHEQTTTYHDCSSSTSHPSSDPAKW
jgi:hypothetical protein